MNLDGLTFAEKLDVLDEYRAANPVDPLPYELEELRTYRLRPAQRTDLERREDYFRFFFEARSEMVKVVSAYREAVAYVKGYTLFAESARSLHRLSHEVLEDIKKGSTEEALRLHRTAEGVLTETLDSLRMAEAAETSASRRADEAQKILEKMRTKILRQTENPLKTYCGELEELRVRLYTVAKALKDGAKLLRYRPPTFINFFNEVLATVQEPVKVELPSIEGRARKEVLTIAPAGVLKVEEDVYQDWLEAVKELKG
jgi:hypothetical protein